MSEISNRGKHQNVNVRPPRYFNLSHPPAPILYIILAPVFFSQVQRKQRNEDTVTAFVNATSLPMLLRWRRSKFAMPRERALFASRNNARSQEKSTQQRIYTRTSGRDDVATSPRRATIVYSARIVRIADSARVTRAVRSPIKRALARVSTREISRPDVKFATNKR